MNTPPNVLAAATPESLAQIVRSATSRLVVLAPAVARVTAEAIRERWLALGSDRVSVTLDVDPEVYRLGYGDAEALDLLEDAGATAGGLLQRHAGIRIGVVIADDRVLVFSPVPALVEAGPRDKAAPNAVMFGGPTPALENALGVGSAGHVTQEIGLDKATRRDIDTVRADLQKNPPQKFDLARKVRIFNAAFQFVELTMTGTNVGRRTIRVPNHLLGVTDHVTRDALRTVLTVLPSGHDLSGQRLESMRRGLERDYLTIIPSYGYVVLREKKAKFEAQVALLKVAVQQFKEEVRTNLDAELERRVGELTAALLPRLQDAPPDCWLLPPDQPERSVAISECLGRDLQRSIGGAEGYVKDMEVRVVFKDVTYESLTDNAFLAAARKALPDMVQLHDEVAAAVAVDDSDASHGRTR
jgi:hypothetical protein